MLELLARYAHQRGLEAEPGFAPKQVRWAIACADGPSGCAFLDVIELGEAGQPRNKGQLFAKCPDLSQPEMVAGGITKSHFLVDTAQVVALLGDNATQPKVTVKHKYFIGLLQRCATVMPELGLVASLLDSASTLDAIQNRLTALKARPEDKVTFSLGGRYLVELDGWHDWWRLFRTQLAAGEGVNGAGPSRAHQPQAARESLARCMLTGQLTAPLRTHPKIKGLAHFGGIASGDALISFDKEAFKSYGLEQSCNAPVSEEAANAYRAALDYLIREHGQTLAGVRIVHWFKERVPEEDDVMPWLSEGADRQDRNAQEALQRLLSSIRTGQRADLGANRFYALSLSGVSGRVMVRDWMEGRFEELVGNIAAWFADLEMVQLSGEVRQAPGIERLVTSLLPRKRDQQYVDWVRPLGAERGALWRSAVRGDPIPTSVLARVVSLNTRFHVSSALEADLPAGETLLRIRMALVRAYWKRKKTGGGENGMTAQLGPYLNESHPSPAYHCGRIMAVLGEIQRVALRDVGASVVQRYYGAASATPALVLGRLVRLAQFHLDKVESRKRRDALEQSLAGIWASIHDHVPATLTLEEQSLFALGYYQQKAAAKREAIVPADHGEKGDDQ